MSSQPAQPIFIVGSNGSGSTLLRLMLDSHERIAIPDETGFLRLAAMHRWIPYWSSGGDWYRRIGLDEDALIAHLATFYDDLFTAYAASRGKERWGDKTPFHVWHLELATRMFPEARIIGIVRHPAAAVHSMRRRFRRPIGEGITHWMSWNRQLVHEGAALGPRFALLRYEDLVTNPEPLMRELLTFLDEPWSASVLAHHELQPPTEAAGYTSTSRAVDTKSLTTWESELDNGPLDRVVRRTAGLATFFGYDPQHGIPLDPIGASLLLSGTNLAARRDRSGSGIDWTPPRPRPADRPLKPPMPGGRAETTALADVGMRALLKSRIERHTPAKLRAKLGSARRSSSLLDRIAGPR